MFTLSQGHFSIVSCSASEKDGKETARSTAGTGAPGSPGIFHTIECHAQYINWGEFPGSVADLGSVHGEQLHCVSLVFPLLLSSSLLFTIGIAFYFNSNY